jgi:hypothetical protein
MRSACDTERLGTQRHECRPLKSVFGWGKGCKVMSSEQRASSVVYLSEEARSASAVPSTKEGGTLAQPVSAIGLSHGHTRMSALDTAKDAEDRLRIASANNL